MGKRADAMHQTLLFLAAANDEALRAGVRLDAAREAVAAQDCDDLQPLGLDDSLTGQRWVSPVPARYAAQMLPPTEATRAITKEHRRWRESDLRLLEQLTADPQSPGSRLLRRLGIEDPATLTAAPASARQWSGAGATRVELSVPGAS